MDHRLSKKKIEPLFIAKDENGDLNLFLEHPVFHKDSGTWVGNYVTYLGKSTEQGGVMARKLSDIEVNLPMTKTEKLSMANDKVKARLFECPLCGEEYAFDPVETSGFSFFCDTCYHRISMDMNSFKEDHPVVTIGEPTEPICEVCGNRMEPSVSSAVLDGLEFIKTETFICRECGATKTVTTH